MGFGLGLGEGKIMDLNVGVTVWIGFTVWVGI